MGMPEEAVSPGLLGKLSVYPWYLETLVNELLALERSSMYQMLDHRQWNTIVHLRNLLHSIEGA
jgi:hypothetical protein